ncbi:MAG TPA: THUMP domain-containing protein [Chitinophagales bacterium]|nr:THUMP domain-containing protein [Chitinophagales bacterium]
MNVFETKIICKTFQGLEQVLADELNALQAKNVEIIKRAVVCDYDLELLYRCNLELRTCLKVLVPLFEFESNSPEDLYGFAIRIPWEDYFTVEQSFAIDFTIKSEFFTHSQFASLKLKDAICDRFRKFNNDKRPDINSDKPDILFNLHIYKNNVTISLDSSGTSLHQRGNRIEQTIAPINEVLAAGLILMSKWDRQSHFVDAMCGSGTIVMEAASMAINKAPNLDRSYFCFKNWKNYDKTLFNDICTELELKISDFEYKIIGSDNNKKAVFIAQNNIKKAGFSKLIEIRETSIQKMIPPMGRGTLIINPPYGERMEAYQIDLLYKQIGDAFKQHFTGYTCGIISNNFEGLKNIGLKPMKKYPVINGKLECVFYLYEMYEGTKRKQKEVVSE